MEEFDKKIENQLQKEKEKKEKPIYIDHNRENYLKFNLEKAQKVDINNHHLKIQEEVKPLQPITSDNNNINIMDKTKFFMNDKLSASAFFKKVNFKINFLIFYNVL